MKPRDKRMCNRTARYFRDMINPNPARAIPKKIMNHINDCPNCMENLAQFHRSQSSSDLYKDTEHRRGRKIAEQMERHLELIGVDVDCRMVKEFLPLLADPELKITVPTPITAHLDECKQCTAGYSVLGSLNLNSEQLAILSRFYSQPAF